MSKPDPFDLEKLRRNWDRAADPEPLSLPVRAARVRAPADAHAEGKALLAKVRALGLAAHPTHKAALLPFLDRAEAALALLGGGGADGDAAREELLTALVDLEDLFDVFAMTKR